MPSVKSDCGGARDQPVTSGRVVYICHAYSSNPRHHVESVRGICRDLAMQGLAPIAPQLSAPQYLDEGEERRIALRICLALVGRADELRVYGEPSEGMRLEIAEARRLGIPVLDGETGEAMPTKREPPRHASARAAVKR